MTVPYWVQDSIFYQIFPDRFANGDDQNDPANVRPWSSLPTNNGFHGGDLRGIIQKLDYLLDLGVTALYLNPIFLSPSTHRYNTTDYFQIDPKLGTLDDFHALLSVAHRNNIHVILDGVFNHCGRGFFAFADVLENQQDSPYTDWFYINHFPIDAFTPGDATDYIGWWKFKSLPKLNLKNPQVRQYILKVARYWIEQGADGWRLDVPNEIDDDIFWADFRENVLSINPDAYILGEIWTIDPRWANSSHFDGLMNYPVREAILKFIKGDCIASKFGETLDKVIQAYPRENLYAMYNLLDSHDTERIQNSFSADQNKVLLAYMFQFAFPGVPSIYYGDEIGLSGGKDPDSRRAFPWDQTNWNKDIYKSMQQLIRLRKRIPALRRGDYHRILADDSRSCFGFYRGLGDDKVLILLNGSNTRRLLHIKVSDLDWEDGRIIHNLLGNGEYIVAGDMLTITLSPFSGVWLH